MEDFKVLGVRAIYGWFTKVKLRAGHSDQAVEGEGVRTLKAFITRDGPSTLRRGGRTEDSSIKINTLTRLKIKNISTKGGVKKL